MLPKSRSRKRIRVDSDCLGGRFFVEEKRLGMGAQGTVYLCRHVVNGNFLSYHAVKKIAVGNSKEYLADMLREVRLLENIRHKNIIPYETIWVEPASFSRQVLKDMVSARARTDVHLTCVDWHRLSKPCSRTKVIIHQPLFWLV